MNEDVQDELISINAIYGEGTLTRLSNVSEISLRLSADNDIANLANDGTSKSKSNSKASDQSVHIKLSFPTTYPDEAPCVSGILSVGNDPLLKGQGSTIIAAARDVLSRVFVQGQPCVTEVLEELVPVIATMQRSGSGPGLDRTGDENTSLSTVQHREVRSSQTGAPNTVPDSAKAVPSKAATTAATATAKATAKVSSSAVAASAEAVWTPSLPVTEKKSLFIAHVTSVQTLAQAKACLTQLISSDKRLQKATHNISAWRIRSLPGGADGAAAATPLTTTTTSTTMMTQETKTVVYQDCDDDGETAAGGRLLHLLQLTDVWNVVVVVSRWYGGVHLGPARFKIINSVARDALARAGLVRDGSA